METGEPESVIAARIEEITGVDPAKPSRVTLKACFPDPLVRTTALLCLDQLSGGELLRVLEGDPRERVRVFETMPLPWILTAIRRRLAWINDVPYAQKVH